MSAARHTTSGIEDHPLNFRLPPECIAALDAEGAVRGKTWRSFLFGGNDWTLAALSWWLWKRMLPPEPEFSPEDGEP